ncbi:unnamed protein product [Heterosigma akashiwo]
MGNARYSNPPLSSLLPVFITLLLRGHSFQVPFSEATRPFLSGKSVNCNAFSTTSTTMDRSLIFRQLFEAESSTYTYILGCPSTKEAIIIDPVDLTAERDAQFIRGESN